MFECCTCQDHTIRDNLIHRFLAAFFFNDISRNKLQRRKRLTSRLRLFLGTKEVWVFLDIDIFLEKKKGKPPLRFAIPFEGNIPPSHAMHNL